MKIKEPQSMDALIYYTKRTIDGASVSAWVYKEKCPKCGKALMGKPVDPKTGKVKIRAKHYVCPACEYTAEKEEYEQTLHAHIKYECPHCKKSGEAVIPYQRKSVRKFDVAKQKKVTVQVLRCACQHCGKDIDISKKMK